MTVSFQLNGTSVEVDDEEQSLLDALRGPLRITSVKDGCSPQGQCGCCTVLVDGAARVSCVTPLRRVAGRDVRTVEGLDPDRRDAWVDALLEAGGSQCGFCTPGILVRLEAQRTKGAPEVPAVERALAAHLCRCTGWQTVTEAAVHVGGSAGPRTGGARDLEAASRRATLEGGVPQRVGPDQVLGAAGFAADGAPPDALVAVPGGPDGWVVAATAAEARRLAGKVQGRRTTVEARPPLEVPPGDWTVTLRTSWVEPAYVETDASWCAPGGEPASALANGGAFGGKAASPLPGVARELADRHGRPVLALWSREDCVRHGPKRPPVAAGVMGDGTGVLRVVRTPGVTEAVAAVAPGLDVVEVDVPGPPTSVALRAAARAEALVLLAAAGADSDHVGVSRGADGDEVWVVGESGGRASVCWTEGGEVVVRVQAGDPLDEVVLRSYCIGAVHMAAGWVTSESLSVDDGGGVHDLTVRSFGVLRAAEMPPVRVEVTGADGPPLAVSDAVFTAAAAALWRTQGLPGVWPTGRGPR